MKVKTESTNNEGNIKKSTCRSKITHSRRRVVSMVLRDRVRDDAHTLQHLLKALKHLLISQLKGRDHTRRVLRPRVLEAIVLSLLQRLNLAAQKAGDDPKAGQALLLQSAYPLKKWLDRLELVTVDTY
jgi:hypothetical protein